MDVPKCILGSLGRNFRLCIVSMRMTYDFSPRGVVNFAK